MLITNNDGDKNVKIFVVQGYEAIVKNDFGTFLEISPASIVKDNLRCKYATIQK